LLVEPVVPWKQFQSVPLMASRVMLPSPDSKLLGLPVRMPVLAEAPDIPTVNSATMTRATNRAGQRRQRRRADFRADIIFPLAFGLPAVSRLSVMPDLLFARSLTVGTYTVR